jgi:hypothetical protein
VLFDQRVHGGFTERPRRDYHNLSVVAPAPLAKFRFVVRRGDLSACLFHRDRSGLARQIDLRMDAARDDLGAVLPGVGGYALAHFEIRWDSVSAGPFNCDGTVPAGQIDLKMHAARDDLGDAGAVGTILEPHDPKFGEAFERARQAGFLTPGQGGEFPE